MIWALVGRPNVGKSSLFNALLRRRRAITFDQPGTTRDLIEAPCQWEQGDRQIEITLMDTIGEYSLTDPRLLEVVQKAQGILFVVDAKSGLAPIEKDFALQLKRHQKPLLLCINKSEGRPEEAIVEEGFLELGLTDYIRTSAVHRRGIEPIREWIARHTPETKSEIEKPDSPEAQLNVALVGKPNSGKSTLMNRLCETEVSLVSEIEHTTRDPIGHLAPSPQGPVQLWDTAGFRRRRTKRDPIESLSVHQAAKLIKRCDVCLLLLKATAPPTSQDLRLAQLIEQSGKPTVLLLNFWDQLKPKEKKLYSKSLSSYLGDWVDTVETLPISAKNGFNVKHILDRCHQSARKASQRVPTSELNRFLQTILAHHPPPSRGRHHFNFLYATQVKTQPPTFVFFMNRKEALPDNYRRYLAHELQHRLGFEGQPVRLLFRAKEQSTH